MVSKDTFATKRGYICIKKWSLIFVSGIGSAQTESEEKSLFQLKPLLVTGKWFSHEEKGGK